LLFFTPIFLFLHEHFCNCYTENVSFLPQIFYTKIFVFIPKFLFLYQNLFVFWKKSSFWQKFVLWKKIHLDKKAIRFLVKKKMLFGKNLWTTQIWICFRQNNFRLKKQKGFRQKETGLLNIRLCRFFNFINFPYLANTTLPPLDLTMDWKLLTCFLFLYNFFFGFTQNAKNSKLIENFEPKRPKLKWPTTSVQK